MEQVFETLIYVEFYLAGDCIFSCKKEWLPNKGDIELKANDLADLHQVPTDLITWAHIDVKLPIVLPKEILSDVGISLSRQ